MDNRKIVAYVRYSSDKQKETSLEEQKLAISKFANSKGEVIDNFYSDSAKTGTNTNRKGYQKLLDDICSDEIKAIYCYALDRLNRDGNDAEGFRQLCKAHDVLIMEASSKTTYDDSIDAKYAYRDKANKSERFSDELSQRIRLSKEASAERNEETGGVAPYGYCIRNKKLEVNYDESPAVKLIFDRYIAGFTYSQIIAELKEKGFKPRTGETFNKSTIHDMLTNKKYCGYYQFRMKPSKKKTKFNVSNEHFSGKEVAGNHDAIISEEEFEKAKNMLKERSEGRETVSNKANYILNGLVFCSKCGSQMNGAIKPSGSTKKKYRSYQCKNHISHQCSCKAVNADALEYVVLHNIFDSMFQNPTELAQMLTQHRKNSASYSSEKVNDLRRTKANLEKKIANGNDTLLRAGYIPSIADALKESNEKLATVNRQLDELRTISIKQVTSKEVEALRTNFYDTIKNHKPELVKALNQCVDSIIVGTDDVTIIYRYN